MWTIGQRTRSLCSHNSLFMPAFNDPFNFFLCAKYHQNNMFIFLPSYGYDSRQSATVLPSPPVLLCADDQNILLMSLCSLRLQFCANLIIADLWNGKSKKMCLYLFASFLFKQKDLQILPILEWVRVENEHPVFHGSQSFDLLLFNDNHCFFCSRYS